MLLKGCSVSRQYGEAPVILRVFCILCFKGLFVKGFFIGHPAYADMPRGGMENITRRYHIQHIIQWRTGIIGDNNAIICLTIPWRYGIIKTDQERHTRHTRHNMTEGEDMTYFINPKTLEELKLQYRQLAMEHHPDRGGNVETMKAINNEYDQLFPRLKDIHTNRDGETYTAWTETKETPEAFKDLIDQLMKMDDIVIEVIGCFVWVTGNTKPYKDQLKELSFRWHSKKVAWYLKPEDYHRRSHKQYELDDIRDMYGSSGAVKSKGTTKLNAVSA
jgi:hypothetical protein